MVKKENYSCFAVFIQLAIIDILAEYILCSVQLSMKKVLKARGLVSN